MKSNKQLENELKSMESAWLGGFGYRDCKKRKNLLNDKQLVERIINESITPYINEETSALEIGCGSGFWTHYLLGAKKIYCFDAKSADSNNFYVFFKKQTNIEYTHVKDFSCSSVPDNSLQYVFSFNVFCHISYSGVDAYLKNLYGKLQNGANCFIHILDIDKNYDPTRVEVILKKSGIPDETTFRQDFDGEANKAGKMFYYGKKRFIDLLDKYQYKVLDEDAAKHESDWIIHFTK